MIHGAGKRLVVDPKSRDFRRYAGADLLTPNAGAGRGHRPWRG